MRLSPTALLTTGARRLSALDASFLRLESADAHMHVGWSAVFSVPEGQPRPTLDALRDGYEVYPVVDAIAGTSPEAHRAGLDRVVQAGGQPISWVSLACELQRDWARLETVPAVVEIVLTDRLLKE